MIGVRGQRRLRRTASGLLSALALGAAGIAVAAPGAQAKTGWKVNATVKNQIVSSADTCADTAWLGCVNAPLWTGVGDVDDVGPPSDVAAGAGGGFSFTSPSLVEGGDMYVDYTMPTGSKYEVIVEDDDHVSDYNGSGNYVGCSQATAQGDSAAVCSAQWGGTYEAMTPTITFGPSSQAPLPSVGQRCSGTMGEGTVLTDCMDTKQWGPTDPSNPMWISFRTLSTNPVYVQQSSGGANCRMGSGYGDTCFILASPGRNLQIGSLDNSQVADYTVEIMATASGYQLPIGNMLPPDPNPQSTDATAVRGLTVNPGAVRPASNGPSVVESGAAKGRGAKIRYRSAQAGTTVFTVARASRGVRRGTSCVRSSAPAPSGRSCTVWRTLPARDAKADIVAAGVKTSGRCVRATSATSGGTRCTYRSPLRGHFAHSGNAGTNTVQFTGRLAGKRLSAGHYRLIAQSRPHRSSRVSSKVTAQFKVSG